MIWLFVLNILIACTGKLVQASCPIKLSPPRVVVRFGDPLMVNCSSTSEVEGIGWESAYGGKGLTTGVSTLPLNISPVKAWIIEPKCYVNLPGDGSQCMQILPVTVYKTPESVSMSEILKMTEGQQYSMKCDIIGVAPAKNLSVEWHKGHQIIHTETFNDSSPHPMNKSSVFSLTANRKDNNAFYWCEAKLNLGSAERNQHIMQSKSHSVTVLYPPTFVKPENETVEVPDKALILECPATGNPLPVYNWNIPDPTEQMNNFNRNGSTLSLSFPLPGIYTCTAYNSLGSTSKYFTLIEATGDRTTFVALLGVFVSLGVLLLVAGVFFVTSNGTLSFSKGSYQPTSSAPV